MTWILAYVATPNEGFFIEFNEATLHAQPTDIVFGNEQYFALFGITMVTIAFLYVDFFQDRKDVRSKVASLGILVTAFTVIVGYIYAFLDPGLLNPDGTLTELTFWGFVYAVGLLLVSGCSLSRSWPCIGENTTRYRFLHRKPKVSHLSPKRLRQLRSRKTRGLSRVSNECELCLQSMI